MADITELSAKLQEKLANKIEKLSSALGEITVVIARENLVSVAKILRDDADFAFNQLMDVCGIDYLHYGIAEWATDSATGTGFERGVDKNQMEHAHRLHHTADDYPTDENIPIQSDPNEALSITPMLRKPRFAAIYHLLSLVHNHRLRLRVYAEDQDVQIPSVISVWPAANWFEREAYDLYGIVFSGHPDLRRILTDYGFVGHPFRKDFPLMGNVEVRYDAAQKKVIYETLRHDMRVLEPKVIRRDNRYRKGEE
jgi:NADH-quinone oxidoreductase subunit C